MKFCEVSLFSSEIYIEDMTEQLVTTAFLFDEIQPDLKKEPIEKWSFLISEQENLSDMMDYLYMVIQKKRNPTEIPKLLWHLKISARL